MLHLLPRFGTLNILIGISLKRGVMRKKILQRQANPKALNSCAVSETDGVGKYFILGGPKVLHTYNSKADPDTHVRWVIKRSSSFFPFHFLSLLN